MIKVQGIDKRGYVKRNWRDERNLQRRLKIADDELLQKGHVQPTNDNPFSKFSVAWGAIKKMGSLIINKFRRQNRQKIINAVFTQTTSEDKQGISEQQIDDEQQQFSKSSQQDQKVQIQRLQQRHKPKKSKGIKLQKGIDFQSLKKPMKSPYAFIQIPKRRRVHQQQIKKVVIDPKLTISNIKKDMQNRLLASEKIAQILNNQELISLRPKPRGGFSTNKNTEVSQTANRDRMQDEEKHIQKRQSRTYDKQKPLKRSKQYYDLPKNQRDLKWFYNYFQNQEKIKLDQSKDNQSSQNQKLNETEIEQQSILPLQKNFSLYSSNNNVSLFDNKPNAILFQTNREPEQPNQKLNLAPSISPSQTPVFNFQSNGSNLDDKQIQKLPPFTKAASIKSNLNLELQKVPQKQIQGLTSLFEPSDPKPQQKQPTISSNSLFATQLEQKHNNATQQNEILTHKQIAVNPLITTEAINQPEPSHPNFVQPIIQQSNQQQNQNLSDVSFQSPKKTAPLIILPTSNIKPDPKTIQSNPFLMVKGPDYTAVRSLFGQRSILENDYSVGPFQPKLKTDGKGQLQMYQMIQQSNWSTPNQWNNSSGRGMETQEPSHGGQNYNYNNNQNFNQFGGQQNAYQFMSPQQGITQSPQSFQHYMSPQMAAKQSARIFEESMRSRGIQPDMIQGALSFLVKPKQSSNQQSQGLFNSSKPDKKQPFYVAAAKKKKQKQDRAFK